MAKPCKVPASASKAANTVGLNTREDIHGRWRVEDPNGRLLGVFNTEEEVRAFVSNFSPKEIAPILDGASTVPARAPVISHRPPKPNDHIIRGEQAARDLGISKLRYEAPAFTIPIQRFFQAAENVGLGPMFSKVWKTTQEANNRVLALFGAEKRAALDKRVLSGVLDVSKLGPSEGRSFNAAMHSFNSRVAKLTDKEQIKLVTLYSEAFTREELSQPGVLLAEGMDALDIGAAKELERLFADIGGTEAIPQYILKSAVIDDFLANSATYKTSLIPAMRRGIFEGRHPEALTGTIDRLERVAGELDNWIDVAKALDYTPEEIKALEAIRIFADDGDRNLVAIYRYATAPHLKPGFKNGRAQFAAERGMTPQARALGEERIKIGRAAFDAHGLSFDQLMGGQLPVFRDFMSVGIAPGKEFRKTRPAIKKYASALEGFVEGDEVFSRRVLSGTLNPHELHPSVSLEKHILNLIKREHLDPAVIQASQVLDQAVKLTGDERLGRIGTKYLHDLEGRPDESFVRLNQWLRSIFVLSGKKLDDDFSRRFIRTLNWLNFSASIPLRAALVVRNAFQSSLLIPIMGVDAFYNGAKRALGFGSENVLEGMARSRAAAVKAGAVPVEVLPLHGATEALATGSIRANDLLPGQLARVGFHFKELINKGFSVYRYPDDFGRTIAFETGRYRVNKYIGEFVRNRDRNFDKALEILKQKAKVKTFDPAIETEFDRIIRSDVPGNYDAAADFIGKSLADKVFFLYHGANHPTGWSSVSGKLLGQFGTFPVQYAQYVVDGLAHGSAKDRMEFAAGTALINASVIIAGEELFGANLESWAFLPSLQYTGGPGAELFMSAWQAMGGSPAERALAARNIEMMMPSFRAPWDPEWHPSIYLPGSYFLDDLMDAGRRDSLGQAFFEATGVRFFEPRQESWIKEHMKWMYDLF